MKIHIVQHDPEAEPGWISPWIQSQGHKESLNLISKDPVLPTLDEFDATIILGGSANIDEEKKYPWLKAEKKWIKQAISAKKKVLGICLGGQLIADVLGARVYRTDKPEIGWFEVEAAEREVPDLPAQTKNQPEWLKSPFMTFHWHGYQFDLPKGGILLAKNSHTPHQAFQYQSNVLALQFHPEVTPQIIHDFFEAEKDPELSEQRVTSVQSKSEVLRKIHFAQEQKLLMEQILSDWLR